jgi:hypothetical protein
MSHIPFPTNEKISVINETPTLSGESEFQILHENNGISENLRGTTHKKGSSSTKTPLK